MQLEHLTSRPSTGLEAAGASMLQQYLFILEHIMGKLHHHFSVKLLDQCGELQIAYVTGAPLRM